MRIDLSTKFCSEDNQSQKGKNKLDSAAKASTSHNILETFIDLNDRQCVICLTLFNHDLNNQLWRNCEGRSCDAWYCASCSTLIH